MDLRTWFGIVCRPLIEDIHKLPSKGISNQEKSKELIKEAKKKKRKRGPVSETSTTETYGCLDLPSGREFGTVVNVIRNLIAIGMSHWEIQKFIFLRNHC